MLLTGICQQLLIILSLMLKMSQLHLKRVARMQRCPKAKQNRKLQTWLKGCCVSLRDCTLNFQSFSALLN